MSNGTSPMIDLFAQIVDKAPYAVLCVMVVGIWKLSRLVERVQSQNCPSRKEFEDLRSDVEELRRLVEERSSAASETREAVLLISSRVSTLWSRAGISDPRRPALEEGDPFRRRPGQATATNVRQTPYKGRKSRPDPIPREEPESDRVPLLPEGDDDDE